MDQKTAARQSIQDEVVLNIDKYRTRESIRRLTGLTSEEIVNDLIDHIQTEFDSPPVLRLCSDLT